MSTNCKHGVCRDSFECHWLSGSRVELHPATDRWMMGDRYGTIVRAGRTKIAVLMDKSGKVIKVRPSYLAAI
jgi:hypothetical protein